MWDLWLPGDWRRDLSFRVSFLWFASLVALYSNLGTVACPCSVLEQSLVNPEVQHHWHKFLGWYFEMQYGIWYLRGCTRRAGLLALTLRYILKTASTYEILSKAEETSPRGSHSRFLSTEILPWSIVCPRINLSFFDTSNALPSIGSFCWYIFGQELKLKRWCQLISFIISVLTGWSNRFVSVPLKVCLRILCPSNLNNGRKYLVAHQSHASWLAPR